MEQVRKTLEKIGLNEKEIKIYLTSLSVGQSPASILGKKNNIARSTSNYVCQSLVEKGLMSSVLKGNTFIFSPESPQKLVALVNKEYEAIERKMSSTQKIIGDLQAMMNPEAKLPSVKYFTGITGIKEMFQDVLNTGKDVSGFIDLSGDINFDILEYIKYEYIPARHDKGIKAFSIFNDIDLSDAWRKNSQNRQREYRVLVNNEYPLENCIQIYGGKVAFYSLKNNDLTGVIIDNEYIYQTQLTIFKFVWRKIKES